MSNKDVNAYEGFKDSINENKNREILSFIRQCKDDSDTSDDSDTMWQSPLLLHIDSQ